MAYFCNGTEGDVFAEQCSRCKYGKSPCPVFFAQTEYNYDQLKDETGIARQILDVFVKDDGTCEVFDMAKEDFEIDG